MPLEIIQEQSTTINDDVQFDSVTAQLDANNEIITNVGGPPVSNSDGANKQYVDDKALIYAGASEDSTNINLISPNYNLGVRSLKLGNGLQSSFTFNDYSQLDLKMITQSGITDFNFGGYKYISGTDLLPRDGGRPMTGNLDMNTNNILDLRTSDTQIHLGNLSGVTTQGTNTVALGTLSGNINQQQDSVAIGNTCGQTSQGAFSVGVGLSCANANQGQQCVALGYNSQNSSSNNNSTALGARSGETNQHSKSICINANTSALNSTAEDQIKLKAGVTEFTYDVNGFVIANNVDTIGSAEGSLRTLGGITSTKNMYCGANMYIVGNVPLVLSSTNTTDSTSVSTGAVHTAGGLGVAKTIHLEGSMVPSSGNLKVYGGLYAGLGNRPACTGGYSMTSDGDAVVNTIVETSLLSNASSVGSLTVGANTMKVGSTSHWMMGGIIETNSNSETIDVKFYSGATLIVNYLFTLGSKLDANSGFKFTGDIVCRSVGVSGSIMTTAVLSVGDTNGQSVTRNISQSATIDTTIANTFDVRVIWGAANLNNTITARQLTNFNIYHPL